MRIALLKGGISPEREVSLKSAIAIENALSNLGYDFQTFDLPENDIIYNYKLLKSFDLVFLAYHGGMGEDGHTQAILESMEIPFTGSNMVASVTAMDKLLSKHIFVSLGIPTPKWLYYHIRNKRELNDKISKIKKDIEIKLGDFPLIVKPSDGGSTIGLNYVERTDYLYPAIEESLKISPKVLIEEFFEGREMTVSILTDKPLAIVEIKPSQKLYDYTCKYTKGMSEYVCPADIPQTDNEIIKKYASQIFKEFGCSGYARIDLRYNNGEITFLEVNTLPGMTNLSLVPMAAKQEGIEFDDLIRMIIEEALRKGV